MRTFSLVAVVASGLLIASTVLAQNETAADLAKALKSSEAQARVEACQKLCKLGPAAKVAVPALIEALKAQDNAAAAVLRGAGARRDWRGSEGRGSRLDRGVEIG